MCHVAQRRRWGADPRNTPSLSHLDFGRGISHLCRTNLMVVGTSSVFVASERDVTMRLHRRHRSTAPADGGHGHFSTHRPPHATASPGFPLPIRLHARKLQTSARIAARSTRDPPLQQTSTRLTTLTRPTVDARTTAHLESELVLRRPHISRLLGSGWSQEILCQRILMT